MKFAWMTFIMNPFVLMFIAVITGLLFGKIKFGTFGFGVSGALFTGLFFGWGAYTIGGKVLSAGDSATGYAAAKTMMDNGIISYDFFNFFLIIFVAAVGLLAAKDMKAVLKRYGMKFVILAVFTTFIGGAATYGMTVLTAGAGSNATAYEVSGVYTGALTSSPGLAAALETAGKHATGVGEEFANATLEGKRAILRIVDPEGTLNPEEVTALSPEMVASYVADAQAGVGIGHAIAYPFGVLIVILGMNCIPRITRMNLDEEWKRYRREMEEAKASAGEKEIPQVPFNIGTFILTCFLGFMLGELNIYMGPLGYFTLGSTGGVLIMALVLGYIGKIGPLNFRMDANVLTNLRQLGLAMFLGIVGLKYGGQVVNAMMTSGLHLALVAIVVGISALILGFILGRYVFKLNWILLSGAVCGGMTSTPGLGAAVDALDSDAPAAGYGATYPFALLTKVILVIVLHKLPMPV